MSWDILQLAFISNINARSIWPIILTNVDPLSTRIRNPTLLILGNYL